MATKRVTIRIPKKHIKFINKVDMFRDGRSWADLLVESLLYNPKYNILFELSPELYDRNLTLPNIKKENEEAVKIIQQSLDLQPSSIHNKTIKGKNNENL